jgi:hypothetical protein
MTDSILPESDREWLANLIRNENAKLDKKIDGLGVKVDKLEERQSEQERALRDSTITDLDHERRIADAHLALERMGATAGAIAGKAVAESSAKKWGALYALIAAIHTVVNLLGGQPGFPVVLYTKRASEMQVRHVPGT